jgi:acyl-CoA thioester hydrolase
MSREEKSKPFIHEFEVDQSSIDENGHVNNVVYIQWMQDVAVLHSQQCGGTDAMRQHNCSWVVRSHTIDYLSPAFEGDLITAVTWVANFRKVRSLRRYKFIRQSDGKLLARGNTDWVYVDARSGKPCAIPESVSSCFPLLETYS